MSALTAGCAMVAFSPAAILSLDVLQQPQHTIVALAGAFSYLLCILTVSIFWAIIRGAEGEQKYVWILIISSVLQNMFRILFVTAYRKTEYMIKESSEISDDLLPLHDDTSGIAGGLGIGFMHALVVFGSTLASSDGSGDYFSDSCPYIPLVVGMSLMALGFFIMDMITTCLTFIANRTGSRLMYAIIFILHLAATLTSLGNRSYFGCKTSLSMLLIVIGISSCFMHWVWPLLARGSTVRRRGSFA